MSGTGLNVICYFQNPSQVGQSKVWLFDAHMCVGQKELIARLRVFNEWDFVFGDIGLYSVNAWVARMDDKFELGDGARPRKDYALIGDVQTLIPLHEMVTEKNDDNEEVAVVRLPSINIDFLPYLIVTGPAFNPNKDTATFDMDIRPYLQAANNGYASFPLSCNIPNSGRWKSNDTKPMPFGNKPVYVAGFLTGISTFDKIKGSAHKTRFTMDVIDIRFMGTTTGVAAAPSTPAVVLPVTPSSSQGTPSWLSRDTKKRKVDDSGDAPSSSPGPSGTR
ncbi:hypothetical protein DFH06DRAFT_1259218 [Mycena polygramma]|nr:hypothetical protein DFH06DRAFT_1259218 [Mycena polygramma]